MAKPRHRSTKNDDVLRIYGPRRFGFDSIETVRCFYCDIPQKRINHIDKRGNTHSVRLVHGHHIYPMSLYPRMARVAENYIFLCEDHHREFHTKYDRIEKVRNPDFNPDRYRGKKKGNNFMFASRIITASADDLQEYLGLTAKETIAHQFNWPEHERKKAKVRDGYYADRERGRDKGGTLEGCEDQWRAELRQYQLVENGATTNS